MEKYYSIRWINNRVRMIDQRKLPEEVVYLDFDYVSDLAQAIKDMVIRGAPAIGAAAGYGMALAAIHSKAQDLDALQEDLAEAAECLRAARPTAVNLFWAIERVLNRLSKERPRDVHAAQEIIVSEAVELADEDARQNRQIGVNGLAVVPAKANIIHHCNTGALATVEYGTALGVIRAAHENGKNVHVYVDETRPRLQGARLTAWELQQLEIPHTVIVDGASGYFMRAGKVDLCLVGCDRVAANGDTANKIGTYNLALVAYAHSIPFYVVGPTSTVDLKIAGGDEIPIEHRPEQELTRIGTCKIVPGPLAVANPAFDVTPARFITGIITEKGIAYPPFEESLARFCRSDD